MKCAISIIEQNIDEVIQDELGRWRINASLAELVTNEVKERLIEIIFQCEHPLEIYESAHYLTMGLCRRLNLEELSLR